MVAPEFPAGLDWVNTPGPIRLSDLKGKVVLLDFWTYCCINCMHIIPDLKRLEREFPVELVVIGVHSAKFTQEGRTENIRQAVARYEIEHPVVNDYRFVVWQSYGANAWPTVVLIDPLGRIVMQAAGEGVYARFAEPIRKLVVEYSKQGVLTRDPLKLTAGGPSPAARAFSFPGKVTADETGRRLFISDQNRNRIVIWDAQNERVIDVIGSGETGLKDGQFESATFNHPQGMTLVGDRLYIADTENHAIREADLTSRMVTTLAGNGSQLLWPRGGGKGSETALSSPWDIVHRDGLIYIAMAGTHQIWTLRIADGWVEPFAGSGREGLHDGPRLAAALAQPSGLALLGDRIYFADSEVSAIRFVELGDGGQVGTVVGEDLFEFGDRDGIGDAVRLQHPLGIATDGKVLYIADTYNSKVKIIDPSDRSSRTLYGNGEPGLADGEGKMARLYEPGGIAWAAGRLYIADTNNHLIRSADPSGRELTTLQIEVSARSAVTTLKPDTLDGLSVGEGKGALVLRISLPTGMKLNDGAPVVVTLTDGGGVIDLPTGTSREFRIDELFELPVVWMSGRGVMSLEVSYVYCGEIDPDLCYPGHHRIALPVDVVETGVSRAALTLKPRPKM
ncbi:MAG: redoxin domain-containing protein [Calditrichaeota bacterium]|nr:redoxin domain-containing protein [Calditrichota bacterium]